MKKCALFCAGIALMFACNKKSKFNGPDHYADDFEVYAQIDDLIDGNDERWSFFQVTSDSNSLTVDTAVYHSGNRSIRSYAAASTDDLTSKCSFNKQHMTFWENETVVVDFWCYLEGNDPIDWLFLFDLEEKVPVGAGPGMRLAIVDNKLLVEHKYPNPNIEQPSPGMVFPRDQWVHIQLESLLSRKDKGYVHVYQNDTLVLFKDNWQTLPKDILYANQGTKGMYNQIEFGITANADDQPHVLYVDDINVYTKE